MNKTLFSPYFPLQLAAVAGVLSAFSALLAEIPPLTVIIRGLLAVVVFALLGQLLLSLWQNFSAPQLSAQESSPSEPSSPATEFPTMAMPGHSPSLQPGDTFISNLKLPQTASESSVAPLIPMPKTASSPPPNQ